jgi:hypothetical protein
MTSAVTGDIKQGILAGITGYGLGSMMNSGAASAEQVASLSGAPDAAAAAAPAAAPAGGTDLAFTGVGGNGSVSPAVSGYTPPAMNTPGVATGATPTLNHANPSTYSMTGTGSNFSPSKPLPGIGQGDFNQLASAPKPGYMDALKQAPGNMMRGFNSRDFMLAGIGEGQRAALEQQEHYEDEHNKRMKKAARDMARSRVKARPIFPGTHPSSGIMSLANYRGRPGMAEGGQVPDENAPFNFTVTGGGSSLFQPYNYGMYTGNTGNAAAQQQSLRGDFQVPAPQGYKPGFDSEWNYFPLGTGGEDEVFDPTTVTNRQLLEYADLSDKDRQWFNELFGDEEELSGKTNWANDDLDQLLDSISSGGLDSKNKERMRRAVTTGRAALDRYVSNAGRRKVSTDRQLGQANTYLARAGLGSISSLDELQGMADGGRTSGKYRGGRTPKWSSRLETDIYGNEYTPEELRRVQEARASLGVDGASPQWMEDFQNTTFVKGHGRVSNEIAGQLSPPPPSEEEQQFTDAINERLGPADAYPDTYRGRPGDIPIGTPNRNIAGAEITWRRRHDGTMEMLADGRQVTVWDGQNYVFPSPDGIMPNADWDWQEYHRDSERKKMADSFTQQVSNPTLDTLGSLTGFDNRYYTAPEFADQSSYMATRDKRYDPANLTFERQQEAAAQTPMAAPPAPPAAPPAPAYEPAFVAPWQPRTREEQDQTYNNFMQNSNAYWSRPRQQSQGLPGWGQPSDWQPFLNGIGSLLTGYQQSGQEPQGFGGPRAGIRDDFGQRPEPDWSQILSGSQSPWLHSGGIR